MRKLLTIESHGECPYFSSESDGIDKCSHLEGPNDRIHFSDKIGAECPLPNASEVKEAVSA